MVTEVFSPSFQCSFTPSLSLSLSFFPPDSLSFSALLPGSPKCKSCTDNRKPKRSGPGSYWFWGLTLMQVWYYINSIYITCYIKKGKCHGSCLLTLQQCISQTAWLLHKLQATLYIKVILSCYNGQTRWAHQYWKHPPSALCCGMCSAHIAPIDQYHLITLVHCNSVKLNFICAFSPLWQELEVVEYNIKAVNTTNYNI